MRASTSRPKRFRLRRSERAFGTIDEGHVPTTTASATKRRERAVGPHREALLELARLVRELERYGHAVRVSMRALPHEVSPETARRACLVLGEFVTLVDRRATAAQRIDIRVRTDGDYLALSAQSFNGTLSPGDVRAPDLAGLQAQAEAAGSRLIARSMNNGNWIVIVRLPL